MLTDPEFWGIENLVAAWQTIGSIVFALVAGLLAGWWVARQAFKHLADKNS